MKSKLFVVIVLAWLAALPGWAGDLSVTLDDNYPPYCFRNADGKIQGISVDLWNLWSQKTGVKVHLQPLPWNEALGTMASGKADVLDTVFLTPARAAVYDFTVPYSSIKTAVFLKTGLAGIREPKDLKGFLVGIKAGDAGADVLREACVTGLREYPGYEDLVAGALRGEILVFCMDVPPAVHLLLAKGAESQFREGFVLSEDSFRRAVGKNHPEILTLVNQGFSQISADESETIRGRWEGTLLPQPLAVRTIAVTTLAALVVIALLVVLVLHLKTQIRRRTGQLAGTERRLKQSQDWAKAVVAAIPDLLFFLDSQGIILECRPPADLELFQDPQRFVGRNIAELLPADAAAEVRSKLDILETQGGVVSMERAIEVNGRILTFDSRVVKMVDGRILAIVRDVSVTRQAWQNDLHRNKLESLGVLAGGLAHDFNNSLAVIQGFVSLARVQLAQPDKARQSLDKAVQATRRAAALTSQLRVLAHGGAVQKTVLSVKDLADEAASLAMVGSPCLLAVEAGEGPWNIEADPDELSQVFHNLILNSTQAMPRGGTITLLYRRISGDRISVSVVDEGEGIPQENLGRIFDPYFSTRPQASGLGLAVVHAVVHRHGGVIDVDSRPGRGTVVTLTLPATKAKTGTLAAEPVRGTPEMKGQRVLVMEDEGDLRDLMVQISGSLGLEPVACRNGREAVAAFDAAAAEGRPFVLVVSDLLVPGDMGGREMIAVLRSRTGVFKALAVTGFSTERQTDDFLNMGFDVIVGKPFTVDELKTRIVELMKSPWKTALNI